MARGNAKTKHREIAADEKYDSQLLGKFMNYIMQCGKKSVAQRIVYTALEKASGDLGLTPMDLFDQVLKNVGPLVEVKSKRIGGANYQVPFEVNKDRRNTLAMRWIIDASRKSKGRPMAERLAKELTSAYNGEGAAIKKKDETHKMAEANKAFAHFARF